MKVDMNLPFLNNQPSPIRRESTGITEDSVSPGIGEQVSKAINNVNDLQQNADQMVEQVALGNTEDTHKAVISMEKALLALNFTLSVRNKALEAYQEIMRTQI